MKPERFIPAAAAAIHMVAALAMVAIIRPAADPRIPMADRVAWFDSHLGLWRASWATWMLGAVSLIAFYAWWGSRLGSRKVLWSAVLIAMLGAAFDLTWEARLVAASRETFAAAAEGAGWWTTIFANGFYCIAGVLLTLVTPMPRWLSAWTWAIWAAGFGMTAAGAANYLPGIAATTAVLTVLLCPWFVVMGKWLERKP